jgi:ORF6N domain
MDVANIESKIYEIRGQKVMLDFHLAGLYQVETKVLNQSVKRNINRFPSDFLIQLTKDEFQFLRSQFVTLETGRGKYSKYLPYAFTEQGVSMLSSVLNSPVAIQINIQIIRAFVFIRNKTFSNSDLATKLKVLESRYDQQFKNIYDAINFLLQKEDHAIMQKQRRQIGFKKP